MTHKHNKEYDAAYRKVPEHKKKQKEYAQKYYLANKERFWNLSKELRQKVLDKFGRRCNNPACQWLNLDGTRGCTEERCLQVDHVHNGGNKERKNIKYIDYYKLILKDETGKYQLLCANCNWIKRKEINL
jgi:hypothetical protein